MLNKLDHPNIVRYLESYEDEYFLYMITEYCPGGELFDDLESYTKDGQSYTEENASKTIRLCLEGLQHCHSQNIVHRDLKP